MASVDQRQRMMMSRPIESFIDTLRCSAARAICVAHGGTGLLSNYTVTYNTAAFTIAPQFTIGSASRNPVRGPSYRDVDLALIRRIGLGARQAIEARAEVFNLLNTPNFGAPNAVLGAASFGTITTALDPRAIQLALKFVF